MKSRLAIIATLAVGMVFSTAGIGMAVSGLSGDDNAGVAQYGTPTPTTTPAPPAETPVPTPTPGLVAPTPTPATPTATPTPETGNVAGETESNSPSDTGNTAPTGAVQGETETQPSSNVQPAAQVEAGQTSGNELPFTGFAAIPVILVGALLLTVGMVMRRRNSDDS